MSHKIDPADKCVYSNVLIFLSYSQKPVRSQCYLISSEKRTWHRDGIFTIQLCHSLPHDREMNCLLASLRSIPKQSKLKQLWKTWQLTSSHPYWYAYTLLLCSVIAQHSSKSIFKHLKSPLLNPQPFNPSYTSPKDACCGRVRVGLSLWITHTPSFWFTKYHKRPGGSTATLIRHIRQLTGDYLQRTLRLSLDLAQEINNSPDRYNPRQIWAMGVGSMKVEWACLGLAQNGWLDTSN